MGIKVRVKRGRLYLDMYSPGQPRRWESLHISLGDDPTLNKEAHRLADAIRLKREMQLAAAENGLTDPIAGKQSLASYVEKLAAESPENHHVVSVVPYVKESFGTLRLQSVDEGAMDKFRRYLLERSGLKKTTASCYFKAVKSALRRAVRDRLIERNPAAFVQGIAAPDANRQALTPEEITRLAAVPLEGPTGREMCRAFLFSCLTGLRSCDLRALTWADIEVGRLPRLSLVQQKTGKAVFIPLNPSAWNLIKLDRIYRPEEHVFPVLAETKGTDTRAFKRWALQADVSKPLSWHIARHSFTVSALEAGGGLYEVSKLLGHSSVSQTQVYARASDSMKQKVTDALPEITLAKKA